MPTNLNILCLNSGNSRTGAPILFIKLLQFLKARYSVDITIITTTKGPLFDEFQSTATTYQWDGWFEKSSFYDKFYIIRLFRRIILKIFGGKVKTFQDNIVCKISKQNFNLIYVNSVASLALLEELKKRIKLNCKTILHIHELEIAINQFSNTNSMKDSLKNINHFIAVSNAVKNLLIQKFIISEKKISLIYEYLNIVEIEMEKDWSSFIVCSAGTLDWRKGIDIFIQLAALLREDDAIEFLWIGGNFDSLDYKKAMYDINRLKLNNITITGEVNNPSKYMSSASVFVLTSREDPFPLVCLEAASLRKPIICFDQSGGMPEFVSDTCGYIVPYLSIDSIRDKIYHLKKNEHIAKEFGNNAFEKVTKYHNINIIGPQIMEIFEQIAYYRF
jgi:glycosyltransferase involved in cell wall biosynthesis